MPLRSRIRDRRTRRDDLLGLGAPDAFAAFYVRYANRVLIFFTRRVFDAEIAMDLTAETFATALERSQQYRGTSAEDEQGWLFAIARSQLSHFWRRGTVEREAMRRVALDVPTLSVSELERIESLAGLEKLKPLLDAALREIPADQSRAVRLRVVDELEYAEVAASMGVSEQVARARVSRGLRTLARRLQPLREHAADVT